MNKQVVGTIFYNELANIFKSTYFELLLTGSIVLGDYVFQKSDIDFVVFIDDRIANNIEHRIYRLHDMFKITDNILNKLEGVYYEVVNNQIVGGIYIGSSKTSWKRINGVIHSILEIDILKKHHYKAAETRKDFMKVLPKFISNNVLKNYLLHHNKSLVEKNTTLNDPQFTVHAILWAFRSIYFLNNNKYCSKAQSITYIKEQSLFSKYADLIKVIETYTDSRDETILSQIKNINDRFSELLQYINLHLEQYNNVNVEIAVTTSDSDNFNEIVLATQSYLQQYLSNVNITKEEKTYRYNHSLRVANIGLNLAELEGANKNIVVLSCLLHDIGKYDTNDNVEHGRVSAKIAFEFLKTQNLSGQNIADICYAIAAHVDNRCGYEYKHTLEAAIVSDAGNIDRYGAYRIYKHIQWSTNNYKGNLNKEKEAIKMRIEKLERYSNNKVMQTKSGNAWFAKQLRLQIAYFKEYINEIDMTIIPYV
ncbi:HD domain-containing protein [Clostridium sp. 'deep sea']|uniref:HD domain-containing protein n=1 Tax=Clostridium sp. 'deep sea' TaxID=2779445 RepID=UPI00189648CD|nr:HD domain-containing protein [Clostridium sp. 'deep sea']QOR35118.1 HD domain-containing protein [Clostridium sp. 'deep sea']